MRIGTLDVCLRVGDVSRSLAFYERLGFREVEGNRDAGWLVVSNGDCRIGLFAASFMGDDLISLNFRGGNIRELCGQLEANGVHFEGRPKLVGTNGGSASVRDPDGYLVFFDSSDAEAGTG